MENLNFRIRKKNAKKKSVIYKSQRIFTPKELKEYMCPENG